MRSKKNMKGGITLLKGNRKSRNDLARQFGVFPSTINNWIGALLIPAPSEVIGARVFWTPEDYEIAVANIEKLMAGGK